MNTAREPQLNIQNKPAPRLPGLDILRLGAALLVVIYHYGFRGGLNGEFLNFSLFETGSWVQYFYFGVQLFFIISGFVILWSAENKSWIDFAIARILRLWPAYLICVSITAATFYWTDTQLFETSVFHWLTNLTFFAPAFGQSFMDGVYWTIVLELIFYFWVMAALWAKLLPRFTHELCLGWMIVIVANEFWLESGIASKALLTSHGVWFIIGILMYSMWSRGASAITNILLVTAIALSMIMAVIEHMGIAGQYGYSVEFLRPMIANSAVIFLAAATIVMGNRLPGGRIAFVLGGLTYPLYLVHQNVGYIMINDLRQSMSDVQAVGLVVVAMLVLSTVIFLFWERPVGRLLKHFVTKVQMSLFNIQLINHRKHA
jgi:peptidoglycan/LPS O-acetylase OafA/YrhL